MTHAEPEEKKSEFSTFRIYIGDARDLSRLASLRESTIADTFRDLCSAVVRKALRKESQALANDLGGEGG